MRERRERCREEIGLRHGDRQRDKERHEQGKAERYHVDALQALASQREFTIVAIGSFDRFGVARQVCRHRRSQLQIARLSRERQRFDRHDAAESERAAGERIDSGVAALQACRAQKRRTGQLRHELRHFIGGARVQTAVGTDDERLLDAGLQAQSFKPRHDFGAAQVRELERHGACLGLQFDQHLVDGLLPEIDTALERGVDLDVEPRFDRAGDELHRHGVDDKTRQHGKRRKPQEEPQRQARAEYARTIAARHHQELVAHHASKQGREHRVERKEERILLGEKRGVAARGGEKKEPDRRDRAADDEE